ncbi:MAG TPA: PIN domain-containing protein [Opitutaceae bacterium]|jgi:predicted nucleic acid-binding protein|nr:PIN domain-containing protein [Opitutaceae bacterium]
MAGKVFIDTNVLVYAQDSGQLRKRARSRALIEELVHSGDGVISTQVLQEFYVASTRKLGVAPLAAKAVLKTFAAFETVQVSPELIQEAVDCSILNELSFWDALIIAAASAAGCGVLYSEDLNTGQTILGVKVENPFKT